MEYLFFAAGIITVAVVVLEVIHYLDVASDNVEPELEPKRTIHAQGPVDWVAIYAVHNEWKRHPPKYLS